MKNSDKALKDMEDVIIGYYKENTLGLGNDLIEYFKKFKSEDEKKRKLVEEKKMRGSEYRTWRISLMSTKEYKEIVSMISQMITLINIRCLEYVNERMAYFYCDSYNESGKSIEDEVNARYNV